MCSKKLPVTFTYKLPRFVEFPSKLNKILQILLQIVDVGDVFIKFRIKVVTKILQGIEFRT